MTKLNSCQDTIDTTKFPGVKTAIIHTKFNIWYKNIIFTLKLSKFNEFTYKFVINMLLLVSIKITNINIVNFN